MTLAELGKILDVPFFSWACLSGCRGGVSWEHLEDGSAIATCEQCGTRSGVHPPRQP